MDTAGRWASGRRAWKSASVLTACWLALLFSGVEGALGTQEIFEGRALNSQGGLEYIERHTIIYEDGRPVRSHTLYIDGTGNTIGELISHHQQSPWVNAYGFRDLRAKYEDGVSVAAEKLTLYRKKGSDKEAESKVLARQPNQAMGQGINHFIRFNLDAIAGGEAFRIQLVLPSRLDQYGFQIRKLRQEGQRITVRLEIENWLLRLIAPHVDCEYDLPQRHLLRYVGISNLEDGSGAHKQVDIHYRY